MPDVLNVLMRWLHFSSLATLIGGLLYGRLVMTPSSAALAPEARESLAGRTAETYRPFVLAAVCGLVVSGVYNILTHPGHRTIYHIVLGIKLLLVAHVFATALLITRAHNPRRVRMMTSAAISGLIVIALSAYLGRIF
jgi:uncharacterized membrane protein